MSEKQEPTDHNTVVSKNKFLNSFSIIGVGASAGGLEALKAFFDQVPSDCRHSFVIVQHLSPDYKSLMAELLSKNSALPIHEVTDKTEVKGGTVYLIPPKKNMTIENGFLKLSNKPQTKELNLPIDIFFRSLAKECTEKAIGIILSGTGSDGTSGAGSIKESGGMVMVQSPVQAKFDGMPQSAINTGLIDYVLPVEELPGELLNFIEHPNTAGSLEEKIMREETVLVKVLNHVNNLTNMDFEYYKRPTLIRRIARRMGVNKLNTLSDYKNFLYENPSECHVLAREFLIGVTNFFRDPEVWEILREDLIPKIIADKSQDEIIKIWCVGSSTGQEAYSMAILINEELQKQGKNNTVKIFATDIEKTHLDIGSRGVYPESIIANVSKERISANFIKKGDEYQIREHIRRMVIFSQHNVLKDPPFNKMDIAVCRNLLIYMQPVAQKKVIGVLQYSLKLNGVLVLGSSESVGEYKKVLIEIDRKAKLFRNGKLAKTLGLEPLNYPEMSKSTKSPSLSAQKKIVESKMAEIMNATLAEELDIATVFIDDQYNILNAYGEFRKYISLPDKGFSINLLKMVPDHVSTIISRAAKKLRKSDKDEKHRYNAIRLKTEDVDTVIDLLVSSFSFTPSRDPLHFLLVFIPNKIENNGKPVLEEFNLDSNNFHIAELESELKEAKHNMQNLVQEIETSNEELQATNEELLAANEELQSTNEELQSVNEELHTVNAELQQKVEDLASVNADMDNLLKSTDIGTIFLDRNMYIRKFTPKIRQYFNLMDSDIRRPIDHFTSTFKDAGKNIVAIAQEVLNSGKHVQKEVQDIHGNWFLQKTIPFYNINQTIDGVVMSFVDINELKDVENALRINEEEFRSLYDNAPDMFLSLDESGNITSCNKELVQKLEYRSHEEIIGKNILEVATGFSQEELDYDMGELSKGNELRNLTRCVITKKKKKVPIRVNAKPFLNADGSFNSVIASWRDISELEKAERALTDKNMAFEQVLEGTMAGYWDWMIQEDTEYLSPTFKKMFGYEDHEMENSPEAWQKIIHQDDLPMVLEIFEKHVATKGQFPYDCEVRYYHKNGHLVWVWCKGKVIEWSSDGKPVRMVGSHVDITKLKEIQENLSQSNQELERFAYVASHDLQEPLRTIKDFTVLLREEFSGAINKNAETYINFVVQASNRMGALVKGILEYSKIGKKSGFEMVDLNQVVEDAKKDLMFRIKESNATVLVSKLPSIMGSPIELHSLFLNLIGNALKFTADRKEPVVTISSKNNKGQLQISVQDNGIGIAKENQNKIFEVFKRLHNLDDYEGTGIGLAHCKKIVQLHGGTIWVDSVIGEGSTFHFTLNTKPRTNAQ
ncbi:hypothetical protein MTsPCn5_32980 [Croceitalea sp. MTPC5]|uniref:chemotaxis protein CheB n=1 Tax=Croceitalea sp. MTPC5 TaxID=3056565 RepID=UPI002B3F4EEB|nr:hypothetical protein MTsPCn5_32980 [Croceitalea sp. MTPC5]